jgi:hypothetical protein
MLKRCLLLVFTGIIGISLPSVRPRASSQEEAFKDNGCVICHSRLSSPVSLSNRYFEWHVSLHKDKGVGCEKCHGGDATTKNKGQAHTGVLPASNAQGRIHPANLPETCRACHEAVVSSFVESAHAQKLRAAGLGPSCTTCHAHMASAVAHSPDQAAALCARCHDSADGLLPRKPEVPEKANEVMQSISRANAMVIWAERLFEVGQEKKVDLTAQQKEMNGVRTRLGEAKASWHALNLDAVRKKADDAFEAGTKVKDGLMSKLYSQPKSND